MKVIFINNQVQLGGAETVIQQIRTGLTRKSIDHELWVSDLNQKDATLTATALYPKWLDRFWHSRFHSVTEFFFPRVKYMDKALRNKVRSTQGIYHVHNFHGNYATVETLAYMSRVSPVVWTFHAFWGITGGCDHPDGCVRYLDTCGDCPRLGEWPLGLEDNTSRDLNNKIKFLADAPITIVSPSKHLASKVRSSLVGANWDIKYIPNGIDAGKFSGKNKRNQGVRLLWGLDTHKPIVLVVNRNFKAESKGFPEVKEALRLAMGRSDFQVVLVGKHTLWAKGQLSEGLDVVDLGYISDRSKMSELYSIADIFLFASQAENFPCVILEAMASECCIVSTPTSGVVEQIETEKNGVIAAGNSGESLAQALLKVIDLPDVQRLLGQKARDRVEEHFSEDIMVQKHIDLYRELEEKQL